MNINKGKLVIILLALLVVAAIIIAIVVGAKNNTNNTGGGSDVIVSGETTDASNPTDAPDEDDEDNAPDSNWPESWPAKPTVTVDAPAHPKGKEDHNHKHDPAAEEGEEPVIIPSTDPEYVDDLIGDHSDEDGDPNLVAIFPSYKEEMIRFAEAYADADRDGKEWLKSLDPYLSKDLKTMYKGAEPEFWGFPTSGKVTIEDEADNESGKVKFSISVGNEVIAIPIAQYQGKGWIVIQIDAP